jgi:hypothetical protein
VDGELTDAQAMPRRLVGSQRMRTTLTALVLILAALSASVAAQGTRVASPPGSSATQVGGRFDEREGYIGGKWIEIRYGRPIKRERDLFGPSDFAEALNDGAPVWRAGANISTRLMTEVPIVIAGKTVAPGEYAVFIDLKPDAWTLILSTWAIQTIYDDKNTQALWGAYGYTADKDVIRVPMRLERLAHSFDELSWEFLDMSATGGTLAVIWDKKLASVPFKIAREP